MTIAKRPLSLTVGLWLKGVAIGTLVAVAISILTVLLVFLIPFAMLLGGMLFGGVAATGGGSSGLTSWAVFDDGGMTIPTVLLLAPGAMGFVCGCLWTFRRGVRS